MQIQKVNTHKVKINQTSFMEKKLDVKREWITVDAGGRILGQVASEIAVRLMGKHKATYTPHIESGDYVIVINAAKVVVTGNKAQDKIYYRYSGFPGGLSKQTFAEVIATHPGRVIEEAVKRMVPDNRLRRLRMARLKIYAGGAHPHQSQMGEQVSENPAA